VCSELREDWLKRCSHCQHWVCGKHAAWHIYKIQGEVVGDEVICHACERLGHGPLDMAAVARAVLAGPERTWQKAQRKQQPGNGTGANGSLVLPNGPEG